MDAPARPTASNGLLTGLLAAVIGLVILGEASGVKALALAADAALLAYLALQLPQLSRTAWLFLALAATVSAIGVIGTTPMPFGRAFDQATFIATLIAGLGLLREAVAASPTVETCGRFMTTQPPGRRYIALTGGGHLFSLLLNMGSVPLLLTMVIRGNAADTETDAARKAIRLRRMTLAIMRGFGAVPIWSPFAIATVIVLTNLPQLGWAQLAVYQFPAALLFLGLGWVLDRLSWPRRRGITVAPTPGGPVAILRLIGLVAAMGGTGLALEALLGLRFITAIITAVVLFSLLWAGLPHLGRPWRRVLTETRTTVIANARRTLPSFGSEIAMLSSAGYIGVLLVPFVPLDALAPLAGAGPMTLAVGAAIVPAVLAGGSYVGVNPILGGTLILGVLGQTLFVEAPLLLALSLLWGWGIAGSGSPFTATTMVAAKLLERSPYEICLRWNGVFSLTAYGLYAGLMLVLGALDRLPGTA